MHTPGPWHAAGIVPHFRVVGGNPQELIADCNCGDRPTTGLANARLIAAAPDLLEACRAMVRARDGEYSEEKIARASLMIRAAIVKAEQA